MMAPKVLVSPRTRAAELAPLLEKAGCTVVLLPASDAAMQEFTPAEVDEYFCDADAFVGSLREHYSRQVLEAAERLKIGCSMVIGTENIDVEAATGLGIVIGFGSIPENYLGVSEAVVMLAAALIKQLPSKQAAARGGGWRVAFAGHMVANSTVGMIGVGNIGRGVARRLAPWGCKVIATDPYVAPGVAAELGIELVDLPTLLQRADVVSVQVVLTEETRHLIDERALALMKQGSYLINTSRGPCVDEAALLKALDSGHLAGAAIDVWAEEPTRAYNPLRTHPRVIPTGHNVAHSEELYAALPFAAAENVLRALRGEEPLYVRNPDVLPAWRQRLARLSAGSAKA